MARSRLPLVVIIGPTASGKTSLAIQLAKEWGGEIISADSRAIYKGLDIGTATPGVTERDGVPHWGIDLVDPDERFTAADFQEYALAKITEIRSRGNVPFLVGGSGLYVDSVLYGYVFPESINGTTRRNELTEQSLAELVDYCHKNNVELPDNHKNKRYVVNNILRNGNHPKRSSQPIEHSIVVGISTNKEELRSRIETRAHQILRSGVVEEALEASRKYGWDSEAMKGNVYPLIHRLLDGEITNEEALRASIVLDWRLAKRQLTWFKRSEHIRWLALDDAHTYIAQRLAVDRDS